MRKAIVGLLAAAVAVAGCSSSGGGHAKGSSSAVHPTAGAQADRVFISALRPDFPAAVKDETLIKLAHAMCKDFDAGRVTWVQEVALLTKQGGIPASLAGELIGASVETYCPRNASLLPNN